MCERVGVKERFMECDSRHDFANRWINPVVLALFVSWIAVGFGTGCLVLPNLWGNVDGSA